ncbi:MAG TPA: hypothetical protein VN885_01920 [Candidatus Acidoferrales bacterium]|nr:hypothetical protein [Candidatus Acidoferrales bacterium]
MAVRATLGLAALLIAVTAAAAQAPVHGLWVWKSPDVLAAPRAAEKLSEFCKTEGITEVYVSISAKSFESEKPALAQAIAVLHRENVRVEALLSSTEADEPGKHRDTLVEHAQEIVRFNREHTAARFDGIHLDVEPQQRPENKGPGNLRFLPGLAEAFRAVRVEAQSAGMTVNADIQNKLLKGSLAERKMLLTSVPRLTLMMYELSSPADGDTAEQKAAKVADQSHKFLDMAYDGLAGQDVAKMSIALRTPDYGDLLPRMLARLDDANRANPHYLGWARHSYNDRRNGAN